MATGANRMRVDVSRWNVVYPIYLEKNKKISEGRKVPLRVAAENVSVVDLVDAAKHLGLPHGLENKAYPRDFLYRGRLRISLKDESGNPRRADIPNRKALLHKMGEIIPTMPTYHERQKKRNEVVQKHTSGRQQPKGKATANKKKKKGK